MTNIYKLILITLLFIFSVNANASNITKECNANKTYTGGEICKQKNTLFLAKYWINGFDQTKDGWFEIDVTNTTDWKMEQSYKFGDVVTFENTYFVATQWNINNCPINANNCPEKASRYKSWVGFNYGVNHGEAKLTFKTVYAHDENLAFSEVPILINNRYVGTTNNEGELEIAYELSDGPATVKVSYKGKMLKALIEPDQNYNYILKLKESEIYYEDAQLIGFPKHLNNSDEINIHFEGSDGEKLLSQYLEEVILNKLSPKKIHGIDITSFFFLKENVISIKDKNAFYTEMNKYGNGLYEFCFTTSNDYEQFPSACIEFSFPTGSLEIQLLLPKDTGLPIRFEDLSVNMSNLVTGTKWKIKPNSEGKISITEAELGHWKIHSQFLNQIGQTYHSFAQFELKGSANI